MRKAEIKAERGVNVEELKMMLKKEKDVRVYQRLLAIRMSYQRVSQR